MMAEPTSHTGSAFAMEYIAYQNDWSAQVMATRDLPVQIFIAQEDPTIDVESLPDIAEAYPWMRFEVLPDAGLALMYQQYERLIPVMSQAAQAAIGSKL
jgi:pimeloyl-ACP methyl ester carboxylesterase